MPKKTRRFQLHWKDGKIETMPKKTRRFQLHWKDGKIEIISVEHGGNQKEALVAAFTKAGYGNGTIRALDWWEEIDV